MSPRPSFLARSRASCVRPPTTWSGGHIFVLRRLARQPPASAPCSAGRARGDFSASSGLAAGDRGPLGLGALGLGALGLGALGLGALGLGGAGLAVPPAGGPGFGAAGLAVPPADGPGLGDAGLAVPPADGPGLDGAGLSVP